MARARIRPGSRAAVAAPSDRKRARRPARRGRNPAPRAIGLWRYIWQTTARAQILLGAISVGVSLLDLAPLELQRRIVNDAIHRHALTPLVWLCGTYGVVVILQGITKLGLNVYRNSVGERASRRLRLDTYGSALHRPKPDASGQEGVGISIILSEVDPVGRFIGTSVSEPILHGGVLISVFTYLIVLQPGMAAVALALFAPQFVFVPIMQNAINRRTESRIRTLRDLSVDIVNETTEGVVDREAGTYRARVREVYDLNMQIFRRKFSMNFLMNLLYHFGIVGILFIGGWLVMRGRTEAGTVVAFLSGLSKVNDPWGDLVNFFRELTNARMKYSLIARVLGTPDTVTAID